MRVRTHRRATKTPDERPEQLALDLEAPICSCRHEDGEPCQYDEKWRTRDPDRGPRPPGCLKLQIPF